MRVAVLGRCQYSMFSGSQANATLAVAECLRLQGHDVTLLSTNSTSWWDDIKELEKDWTGRIVPFDQYKGEPFDLLLESGQSLNSGERRMAIAKKTVLVLRKHAAMEEIEHSLFPTSDTTRVWDGLSEIWMFDHMCNNDDIQIMETISRIPVRRIPYVWTPSIIEKHRQELKSPLWIQMTHAHLEEKKLPIVPWAVHIAETNTTSTSSCTVPLLIVREMALSKKMSFGSLRVHNAEHVYRSKFFQDNVWRHARVEDLSGEFMGRQRIPDWVYEPMSICVSHQRFTALRPMLFDMAWVGIPFVHNSMVIRDIECGLDRYYYKDNRITEAMQALQNVNDDFLARRGYFTVENLNSIRKNILERFSPFSSHVQNGWKNAIISLLQAVPSPVAPAPVVAPVPTVAAPVVAPVPTAVAPVPTAVAAPVPTAVPTTVEQKGPKTKITIGFSDMWDTFNPAYNFFILMLQEAGKKLTPFIEVEGVPICVGSAAPDILLFGPFGNTWQSFPSVAKVHFTGENTAPVDASNVLLNLGFNHMDLQKENYLRFPLWILEIDWFGADPEKIVNPKPIPIDRCTKVFPQEIERKKKFCAFVVSNPSNPIRNAAFQWLNSYKQIDSAGTLFNNMGDILKAGPGGGGGELKKLEFLKDYKFALTYENSSSPGYVTEKILHAKAAGVVPIYWGDPKINRDFNTSGFINAQDIKSPAELIEVVKKFDEDEAAWKKMFMVPALDGYRVDWTRRMMSECSKRILSIGLGRPVDLPRFIGATSTAEADEMRNKREPAITTSPETPLLVTFTTRRFLPSIQMWLNGISKQQSVTPFTARIYYGPDVPPDTLQALIATFPFVQIKPIPSTAPNIFSDLWDPQHFAWKLWIYNELSHDSELTGKMIFYMDAGCFLCRWPTTWMLKAQNANICFLEDKRQKNRHWCHDTFCNIMKVTDEEKDAQQIVGGILIFRSGAPRVMRLFEEAWKYAQIRDVIVGEKWSGVGQDGRPYGHRHDQSILSILRIRNSIPTFPLDDVYCDKSLRATFQSGRSIYCHRNNFRLNVPFTEGIDDCYIINLDRRGDRMDRLYGTSPELRERATRVSAIEGKKLELTPELARLFRPHDFFWKKAIMGCALSHLGLWYKLSTEHVDIKNFLILEDDVKLKPEWEQRWREAQPHLPEDWDVIYLGGILPPNRAGFERTKEKVNPYFSRVAPNSFFGQATPTRYFHWCAYAYVLSRRGAEKILGIMGGRDGYWTSADHMICNRVDIMNLYFLDPLVAGCYQDEDPKYQNSAFNDFSRVDGFDSDLWNNDERFSQQDVDSAMAAGNGKELQIPLALSQAKTMSSGIAAAPAAVPAAAAVAAPVQQVEEKKFVVKSQTKPPTLVKGPFICLTEHNLDVHTLYEKEWLLELLGKPDIFQIDKLEPNMVPRPDVCATVVIQRPFIEKYTQLLQAWSQVGATFNVLHLSDEFGTDNIELYGFSGCRKVIRMYDRQDLQGDLRNKCVFIPLGYHWTLRGGGCRDPLQFTPRLPFRGTLWSFYGTNWNERDKKLAPLMGLQPNRVKFFEDWNSPNQVSREEYISTLLDTIFVPCPGGQNPETYRFYEVLECGCIPVLVKDDNNSSLYHAFISANLQVLIVSSWAEAASLMIQLYNDKNLLETYRHNILSGWRVWKEKLTREVKEALA